MFFYVIIRVQLCFDRYGNPETLSFRIFVFNVPVKEESDRDKESLTIRAAVIDTRLLYFGMRYTYGYAFSY